MLTNRAGDKLPSVAVIGAGNWGKNLVRNFHALGSLRTVCDSNVDYLQQAFGHLDNCNTAAEVDLVLSDGSIDAVAIATPADTHGRLIRLALQHGKDVFVEKPLCLSVHEGRELIDLADQKSRVLMVGHLLWYHPAVLRLKELIEAGELGRIEYIYSNRLNLGKIRREENILWSFAPHDVSVVLGLLNGEMPDTVLSQGGNYLHDQIADVTVSLLSFPSGVKAHIFVSWLHPFKEQKLVVVGDKGMAVFNDTEPHAKLQLYPHSVAWENQTPIPSKADAVTIPIPSDEPLREECQHFLQCVASRQRPRTDGEEGLRVLTVLDQCQQSLQASHVGVTGKSMSAAERFPKTRIHESAFIDHDVQIGSGTLIWHVSHVLAGSKVGKDCRIGQNVVIGPRATVGDGVKIQNNVSVYEGVTLEDYVFCGPSMVFTNVFNPRSEVSRMDQLRETLVRHGATLGANCTIVCGTTIGEYAFIGAGAVVTKDVPAHALMVGNPARQIGWMCSCGEKISWIGDAGACVCGRTFAKTDNQTLSIVGLAPNDQSHCERENAS